MRVVDLFAGMGGMTCGALEAGAAVVLSVDSDPAPLKLLGTNAPNTTTVVATLGEGKDEIDLPPAAPDLHIHMSPPCTDFSSARRATHTAVDITGGLQTIRWAVAHVLERNDHSWSLESVATRATRSLLADLAADHPDRVAFAAFDSADFGAPQHRVRLIAGPPALIKMLQGMPRAPQVSVRTAFESIGQHPPAAFYKNQTQSENGGPTMRGVETQSFTVCAGHALTWCEADGTSVRVMTARESAILMGFPSSWSLPRGSRVGQKAVGNAMCVGLAKAIIRAAAAVHNGEAAVATAAAQECALTFPASGKKRSLGVSSGKHRRLRLRVEALERALQGIRAVQSPTGGAMQYLTAAPQTACAGVRG